jgi:hypothetical protein
MNPRHFPSRFPRLAVTGTTLAGWIGRPRRVNLSVPPCAPAGQHACRPRPGGEFPLTEPLGFVNHNVAIHSVPRVKILGISPERRQVRTCSKYILGDGRKAGLCFDPEGTTFSESAPQADPHWDLLNGLLRKNRGWTLVQAACQVIET